MECDGQKNFRGGMVKMFGGWQGKTIFGAEVAKINWGWGGRFSMTITFRGGVGQQTFFRDGGKKCLGGCKNVFTRDELPKICSSLLDIYNYSRGNVDALYHV